MAAITVQQAQVTGTALNLVAASGGGDTIATQDATTYLVVRNSDASSKTVTVVRPGNDEFGLAVPDIAVAVAAGATTVIGPIPAPFRNPSNSLVDVTYSAVTSVTVAAFRAG